MGFGDAATLDTFVCDLDICFIVHNLVAVNPKSIKLGQITTLDMIFHVVVPMILKLAPVSCAISEGPIILGLVTSRIGAFNLKCMI